MLTSVPPMIFVLTVLVPQSMSDGGGGGGEVVVVVVVGGSIFSVSIEVSMKLRW